MIFNLYYENISIWILRDIHTYYYVSRTFGFEILFVSPEKSFRNLVTTDVILLNLFKLNQIWILVTLFPIDYRKKGNYNRNLVWINKIPKRFPCVRKLFVYGSLCLLNPHTAEVAWRHKREFLSRM